jgi:hypothetical protein
VIAPRGRAWTRARDLSLRNRDFSVSGGHSFALTTRPPFRVPLQVSLILLFASPRNHRRYLGTELRPGSDTVVKESRQQVEVHCDESQARFVAWCRTEESAEPPGLEKCSLCIGDPFFECDNPKNCLLRLMAQVEMSSESTRGIK